MVRPAGSTRRKISLTIQPLVMAWYSRLLPAACCLAERLGLAFNNPADPVFLEFVGKQILWVQGCLKDGETRFVTHEFGHCQGLFASGAKLGPIVAYPGVIFQ